MVVLIMKMLGPRAFWDPGQLSGMGESVGNSKIFQANFIKILQ
jgi:hypothetical protein